jgi:DNA-binding NarL/FixJ family response regulator
MIKVLLVDDHKIMREGLKLILRKEDDVDVIAEAGDGSEEVALARQYVPDVVVMDLSMPGMNGIEATRQICATLANVRILALSMVVDRAYVAEALKAGAKGYIVKDCAVEELTNAIRAIHQGTPYFSQKITEIVVNDYMKSVVEDKVVALKKLSNREREILQAIADGKSAKEIAYSFGVSVKTVETQRLNIMKKLDLYSIAELTKYAIREGLTCLG